MRKNIILSPHCDDAAFSLGGLLLSGIIENAEILTVFSISNCTYNNLEDSIENITTIRKKEDEEFFKQCKSKIHLHYMDKLDAPIRMGIESTDVFNSTVTKNDIKICTEIISFILNNFSVADIIYAPLALGNHIDHYIVLEAALHMLEIGYKVTFYEDLPYAENVKKYQLDKKLTLLKKRTANKYSRKTIHTNISILHKKKALEIYQSQLDSSTIDRIAKYHKSLHQNKIYYTLWIN